MQAAAAGKIAVLFLLGADPLADFPDPELAAAALKGAGLVIAVDPFVNASAAQAADIVLPAASFGEVDGTHTNIEGRISAVRQKVTAPGTARADWMIAAELAMRLGNDMGFTSVADITNQIASVSGLHAGADADTIDQAADGVLLPIDGADASGRPAAAAWTDRGTARPATAYDSYSFRLVIDRTMYDTGTQTAMCGSIAQLAEAGAARLNSSEAAKLGVTKGSKVRLSSQRASVEGPVVIDDRIADGVVAVAHNHAGLDGRSLVDMSEPVTDIRIETL